jgi:hypothetical protein
MRFLIPEPLKAEHAELRAELVDATRAGGRVGEAAKAVANRPRPHFVREEEFALAPLGLLSIRVQGAIDPDMTDVLALTDKLGSEIPAMLAEHREIIVALDEFVAAAAAEKKPKQVRFAEKLVRHAQTEEEVPYPAALLVGRYVKLKLRK